MTDRAAAGTQGWTSVAIGAGLLMVVIATGCRRVPPTVEPPPPPPAPVPTDIVVVTVDPDSSVVGRVFVQAQGQSVELKSDLEATRIAAGRPPAAPEPMSSEEFQQRFGPALAARAPEPLYFQLYFESGSNTLVPESRAMLDRVVQLVRDHVAPDVLVIGHTDTTGDAALNARLGLQRATLIRDQLIAAGVPAAQVEATSHGEADLLVATADNVAEARNRRVEITVR